LKKIVILWYKLCELFFFLSCRVHVRAAQNTISDEEDFLRGFGEIVLDASQPVQRAYLTWKSLTTALQLCGPTHFFFKKPPRSRLGWGEQGLGAEVL